MKTIKYQVEFFTDWNCSNGLTGNADIDISAIRDKDGFPYIPGKTIKGLLRDAAKTLNMEEESVKEIFGSEKKKAGDKSEDENRQGMAFFSNAELKNDIKAALNKNEANKKSLFREIASTAIGPDGIAKEKSLRKIEVVIPLTLFGEIECEEKYRETLIDCMSFVKRLGLNRNRGLGRCEFSEVK